jgi:two-component system, sensor histidine kinase and response regulator
VEPSAATAGLILLYVEDEQITRDTVAALIARRYPQLSLILALDGAQGLSLFQECRPDLVLTDIKMPIMHGIEMSRQIRMLAPETPIIVTSAHGDMEYFIESIEIGISRYVMKPIDVERLFAALDETIVKLRLERELKAQQQAVLVLNRHLEARASELEIANRDLESFSYTVSHDLRTPLTNINGYCQVILEIFGSRLEPQCKEFIEVIFKETILMNDLIKTLLEFSRLSRTEPNRSATDLSELALATASSLLARDPERRVSFTIQPGLVADCDPNLVRVVFDNLLGNAYKYSALKDEVLIEFGLRDDGAGPTFFVRDNGAGFDMEQASRLFVPFQRLHSESEFQGFGIGLATVQRIIERHGGRVWAEGVPDQGASFFFTLPAPEPKPEQPSQGAANP